MADITKCKGDGCPLKGMCYRYTAQGGDRQSYFTEPPVKDGKCDLFWGEASQQLMERLWEIVKNK